MLKVLLEAKADINIADTQGRLALLHGSSMGKLDLGAAFGVRRRYSCHRAKT